MGVESFVQYVLCPEVIANLIMEHQNFKDINLAYDEMEDTNDYGFYITNKIPIKENEKEKYIKPREPKEPIVIYSDNEDPLDLFDS